MAFFPPASSSSSVTSAFPVSLRKVLKQSMMVFSPPSWTLVNSLYMHCRSAFLFVFNMWTTPEFSILIIQRTILTIHSIACNAMLLILIHTISQTKLNTVRVVNFKGLNFCGLRSFKGLYFCGIVQCP